MHNHTRYSEFTAAPSANVLTASRDTCRTVLLSMVLGGFIAVSAQAQADDTEVFFGTDQRADYGQPNVLFVLDTSSSMTRTDNTGSSRIARLKVAMTSILNSASNLNVGLMTYNGTKGGGAVLYPVTDLEENDAAGTTTARDTLLSLVDGLTAAGGTPTIDSLYEAALYFRGEGVDFGLQRGPSTVSSNNRRYFRVAHPDSYTGGSLIQPSGCTSSNLNDKDCNNERIVGNPTYNSPITRACQANHIVVLSDGIPREHEASTRIKALTGDATCADSGPGQCGTELARWLNTNDQGIGLKFEQTIKTHSIAFNLDDDGREFLTSIAEAGGGTPYHADSAEELTSVLQRILVGVDATDTGFSGAGATVNQFNRLTNREDVYFALFRPSESPKWQGNLKRFRVGVANDGTGDVMIRDLNGDPAVNPETGFFTSESQSWWRERDNSGAFLSDADGNVSARGGAANQIKLTGLAGIGNRRVYTWVGDADSVPQNGVALTTANQRLHESNNQITDSVLGIVNEEPTAQAQSAYREDLLKWTRGVDVQDSDADGDVTDARQQMGDPLHSRPVLINYADNSASDGVKSIVFIGTNEGFLHAIDTDTGEEKFSFIPSELLGNLDSFYTNEFGDERPYGLDGSISIWRDDVNGNLIVDNNESALLYIGMRRGGNNYYALDVSDIDNPRLAWAIKGGDNGTPGFQQLGESWSRPTPVKIHKDGRDMNVLMFGAGYDTIHDPDDTNTNQANGGAGRGVYIVEAETGKLVWSGLGVTDASAEKGDVTFLDMNYSIAANLRTIDIDRDGYVDQIYAADTGGQLWRFDLTSNHTNQSSHFVQGGVIADLGGAGVANQRRFYTEPDVALVEEDGQRFLNISIGSGWRAHPLDETTNDQFFVIRQSAVFEAPEDYGLASTVGNTTEYRPIVQSDLMPVVGLVDAAVNANGWYLDFTRPGEKVLGQSVSFDGNLIFSTYIPGTDSEACAPEIGSGRVYVLDLLTGVPAFDLDDDGNRDANDASIPLTRGGIPPDPTVLLTEAGGDVPEILIGSESIDTGILNLTRRTFWADRREGGKLSENNP